MAVLVGSSSTGKTRACWEAVQPLAQVEPQWRLWHPFDPTRVDAALVGLEAVGSHTVVWLNEAQHYLDAGEPMASALHRLLTDPARSPVLVLGTLWPEHDDAYATRPQGRSDPHSRSRELLAGRRITVPEHFDATALARARELADGGDRLLAAVLRRNHEGKVAQHLAGAPELLARWHGASPGGRALLKAAADARRLGVGPHLPLAFLAAAAPDYLDRDAYDALEDDWLELALADLARPVHGKLAPLHRVHDRPHHRPPPAAGAEPAPSATPVGPRYRLADYLEQHGWRARRMLCPPASFWYAAHEHVADRGDLYRLALAASTRYRLRWKEALLRRATDAGSITARIRLATTRLAAGDQAEYKELLRGGTVPHVVADDVDVPRALAEIPGLAGDDRQGLLRVVLHAADDGDAVGLHTLARIVLNQTGDLAGAEKLLRYAAAAGDRNSVFQLLRLQELAGDLEGAERTSIEAAADGDGGRALAVLVEVRERAGDPQGADQAALHAADAGFTDALLFLAELREQAGDRLAAEELLQRAVDVGDINALLALADLRRQAGDQVRAEELLQMAWEPAAEGDTYAMLVIALWLDRQGQQPAAEELLERAADQGDNRALRALSALRYRAGDSEAAVRIAIRAAEGGNADALAALAEVLEQDGDPQGAERVAILAANAGNNWALIKLNELREQVEDGQDGAERTALRGALGRARTFRYGLEPDGTPTPPW